jgi:hypothetical protein
VRVSHVAAGTGTSSVRLPTIAGRRPGPSSPSLDASCAAGAAGQRLNSRGKPADACAGEGDCADRRASFSSALPRIVRLQQLSVSADSQRHRAARTSWCGGAPGSRAVCQKMVVSVRQASRACDEMLLGPQGPAQTPISAQLRPNMHRRAW